VSNKKLIAALKQIVSVKDALDNLEGFSLEEEERQKLFKKMSSAEKSLSEFLEKY
jgi:hypothetical protein